MHDDITIIKPKNSPKNTQKPVDLTPQLRINKKKMTDKLKNLKVFYTSPVKFVNYQFNASDEYLLPPDILEIIVKKVFTEEKYKPLIKEARQLAEK